MSWLSQLREDFFPTKEEKLFKSNLKRANLAVRCGGGTTSYAFDVANAYVSGNGTTQNIERALYWLEMASPLKDGGDYGSYELFYWHYYGKNRCCRSATIPVDYAKAIYWGERCMASAICADPMHVVIAEVYRKGKPHVKKDILKATMIYRYIGHNDGWSGGYFTNADTADHPLVKNFTQLDARRLVWQLETGSPARGAPEWFLESPEWSYIPSVEARCSKSGHIYYASYDQWGPSISST